MGQEPASRLPDAHRAFVEETRIRQYLLNSRHPVGGSKARFFLACRFSADHWHEFRDALVAHAQTNPVKRTVATNWGTRCTVECHCRTPDGRDPCIRTVWQLEAEGPRL